MKNQSHDPFDRALGALVGGALGDALGMPTQLLSAAEIRETLGPVEDFVSPAPDHPVSRGLAAGTITDDTEQALLLGKALLAGNDGFDHRGWVNALLDWEREVKARGSYDLLGPSTKRAIDAINGGTPPEEAGRTGDTNGAAMRIGPVGILMPVEPLEALVAKVAETCRATHNTSLAIASAAAVAAAISTGVSGGDWQAAVQAGIGAARIGVGHGHWIAGPDMASRISWAVDLVAGKTEAEAIELIINLVGTGVAAQQSVPAAFAVLSVAKGECWRAAVISANLGGDTDTIGAISAGMAGACAGYASLPESRIKALVGFNLESVRRLATGLLSARNTLLSATQGVARNG